MIHAADNAAGNALNSDELHMPISRVNVVFGHASADKRFMGVVEYEGDLDGKKPVSFDVDTFDKTLAVVFNDNSVVRIHRLNQDEMERVYKTNRENNGGMSIGFYTHDDVQGLRQKVAKAPELLGNFDNMLLGLPGKLPVKLNQFYK